MLRVQSMPLQNDDHPSVNEDLERRLDIQAEQIDGRALTRIPLLAPIAERVSTIPPSTKVYSIIAGCPGHATFRRISTERLLCQCGQLIKGNPRDPSRSAKERLKIHVNVMRLVGAGFDATGGSL